MLQTLPRNHARAIRTNLCMCRMSARPIGHLKFRRPTLSVSVVYRIGSVTGEMMLPVFTNDRAEDSDEQSIEHNHLQEAYEEFKPPMCWISQQRPKSFMHG